MKKIERPQYARIRRILELIREGARLGRLCNARHLGLELEVSRPTVMRDLEFLRDEERAPIDYVPSAHGYRLREEGWRLPPITLSRREVFAFSVAQRLLRSFRGTPLELDMRAVLDKIADSLDGHATLDLESLTDRFTVLGDDYAVLDPRIWSELAGCIERREVVRMEYEKFNGQRAAYRLEPYHLLAYHGDWYVIGAHEERRGPATFAVSRIQALTATSERFRIPAGFNVRKHVDRAFGVVGGGPVVRVRLLFSPAVAAYIRHRVWHPSQSMRERRGGSVELSFTTTGWKELVRWVLSWQPDVRVLAPKALRERVREKMRAALRGV